MLAELEDLHVWIELPDGSRRHPYRSSHHPNYDHQAVASMLRDTEVFDGIGMVGRVGDDVGVAIVQGLPTPADYDKFLKSMARMRDASCWIVDLRANRGGSEPQAARLAGFFNDRRRKYARAQIRSSTDGVGMREAPPRYLEAGEQQAFMKPVVCLIGPGCVSSGEGFALMMKSLPHVTLMGQPSRGASGNPRPARLSNGVVVWFSRWVSLELDGTAIEGRGVAPDVLVEHQGEGDATFKQALKELQAEP